MCIPMRFMIFYTRVKKSKAVPVIGISRPSVALDVVALTTRPIEITIFVCQMRKIHTKIRGWIEGAMMVYCPTIAALKVKFMGKTVGTAILKIRPKVGIAILAVIG